MFPSVDRFAEKYPGLTPYHYGANNPIKYIDVNGDSIYTFNPAGEFIGIIDDGKKEVTGRYYGSSSTDEKGNKSYGDATNFNFNDIDTDREGIKTGKLKVRLVEDSEITEIMSKSGVNDPANKEDAWSYIERESRPKDDESILSGKSSGKMDYLNYTEYGYMNVVGGEAYNDYDYGNFLWGQGGKRSGFSYGTLRLASQLNNAANSRSDNPGVPYSVLDSKADQRAIRNGYNYWVKKPYGPPRK